MTETLTLDALTFVLRRSARRTTLGVTLDRDGSLVLTAPADRPLDQITEAAQRKLLWVYTKLAERELLRRPGQPKQFVQGEGFCYLGRSYRLLLVDHSPGVPPIRLHQGRFLLQREELDRAQEHLSRWYAAHGQPWIARRVERFADRIGGACGAVVVRDLGYRWASCGPSGRLNFHWRTVALPPRIIEYIVVHELAHICTPAHSAAFWKRVELAMPDFAERKRSLDEHGGEYV